MGQIMILFSLFLVFVYSSLHRCGTDIQHRIIFGVVPFYFIIPPYPYMHVAWHGNTLCPGIISKGHIEA